MSKDWVGNVISTYAQLGASSHSESEREDNDFYATDPNSLEIFLNKLENDKIKLHSNIWECACGMGHLSKVLQEHNYNVKSSDLIDRGYGEIQDFLKTKENYDGDILTNPPYKYAKEFVEKGLEVVNNGNYVIMYLKIQFLEGQNRRKMLDKFPPKYVYINSSRQACFKSGNLKDKYSSACCYCWFIWEKGNYTEPIIRWI